MSQYEIVFRSPALSSEDVFVAEMTGHEAISQLFEYTVVLETTFDGQLSSGDIDELMRQTAHVGFSRLGGGVEEARVFGMLQSIEALPAANQHDRVQYRVVLVPRLFTATLTRRTRVFQKKSVPQIIETVLREYGMSAGEHYVLRLNARHPTREYTVQYQESDYAFIARLAEYEGICFYFVHAERGDQVVFTDANEGFTALGAAVSYERRSGSTAHEGVTAISRLQQLVTSKVFVRDYNYRTPAAPIAAQSTVDQQGIGYHYRYAEHAKDTGDARRIARLRAQQRASEKVLLRGQGQVIGFHPGIAYELSDHPISTFDDEYVLLEVWHEIRQRGVAHGTEGATENTGYTNRFVCMPRSVPFRPALRTPWPQIEALTHAKIDGAQPGTPAPIDAQGRYQVVFPWDLVGAPGGDATRWIRMAQPHAGAGWGHHAPLHVGTEVMIAHVDGDPDRPVIVGAVPNPETPSPVDDVIATRGRLLTRSRVLVEYEDDA